MESSGVTITRRTTDVIAANAQLRMLRDHILVKPLEWKPSATIVTIDGTRKPLRGIVMAVGPGQRRRKYRFNEKGERIRVSEVNGQQIPCDVKVGDTVELGGLEIGGYSFPELLIGTERHLICQEADVAMIVDEDSTEAVGL